MDAFARDSGLEGGAARRRYLWTDAFAVCNFLGLADRTGDGRYLELALRLVDEVHHVLGRHRADDVRRGWISGLDETEGELHPTRGGLRIGKPLPERAPGEPFDPRLEWERDGQYLHYSTQWIHALVQVTRATGQGVFRGWAIELAAATHAGFLRADSPGGPKRLAWKMSIALDRALVPSPGQHDPLDAWVSAQEARTEGAMKHEPDAPPPPLTREVEETLALCHDSRWATDDPLGIGALLIALHRLVALRIEHGVDDAGLLARVVAAAETSLGRYDGERQLAAPAELRLAFRELGLAIGLHALEATLRQRAALSAMPARLSALASHLSLAERIDSFWSAPRHRAGTTWSDHADINGVMLATSLAPEGYLATSPPS